MDDRIFFHLSRVENRLKTYMKKVFKENHIAISPAQLGILLLLLQNDALTMSELSRVLEIDNSAITRLVDALEKMHYVKRAANPEDRRQFRIVITEESVQEINRAKQIVRQTNAKIKESIPEEDLKTFLSVLNTICAAFDK